MLAEVNYTALTYCARHADKIELDNHMFARRTFKLQPSRV